MANQNQPGSNFTCAMNAPGALEQDIFSQLPICSMKIIILIYRVAVMTTSRDYMCSILNIGKQSPKLSICIICIIPIVKYLCHVFLNSLLAEHSRNNFTLY